MDPRQIVIAVPAYFSFIERVKVLDAAEIAQLPNVRLVNENTAMGLDYGMFNHRNLANSKQKNVLFVDFGHSKMTSSLIKFTDSQMEVIHEKHHREMGTRNIDMKIYEHLATLF